MENDKIKLLVCCHKDTSVPDHELYLPIQVGSELAKFSLDMEHDNKCLGEDCPNISKLNPIYCEMTAVYWAWKNIRKIYPNLEYVGLCHYRRYFTDIEVRKGTRKLFVLPRLKQIIRKIIGRKTPTWASLSSLYGLRLKKLKDFTDLGIEPRLMELIKNSDILITEEAVVFGADLYNTLTVYSPTTVTKEHLDDLLDIVKDIAPDYYDTLCKQLRGNCLYLGNMAIIKMPIFDEYCDFIFSLVDEHISRTKEKLQTDDIVNDARYARVAGYMAELLTSVFVRKNANRFNVKVVKRAFIKNPD